MQNPSTSTLTASTLFIRLLAFTRSYTLKVLSEIYGDDPSE